MIPFETVWRRLLRRLGKGTYIPNWTVLKGYFGTGFHVDRWARNYIVFSVPTARNLQRVPRDDFEKLWEIWEDYKAGKIKRKDIVPLTRYSKYILSSFRWYDKMMKRD